MSSLADSKRSRRKIVEDDDDEIQNIGDAEDSDDNDDRDTNNGKQSLQKSQSGNEAARPKKRGITSMLASASSKMRRKSIYDEDDDDDAVRKAKTDDDSDRLELPVKKKRIEGGSSNNSKDKKGSAVDSNNNDGLIPKKKLPRKTTTTTTTAVEETKLSDQSGPTSLLAHIAKPPPQSLSSSTAVSSQQGGGSGGAHPKSTSPRVANGGKPFPTSKVGKSSNSPSVKSATTNALHSTTTTTATGSGTPKSTTGSTTATTIATAKAASSRSVVTTSSQRALDMQPTSNSTSGATKTTNAVVIDVDNTTAAAPKPVTSLSRSNLNNVRLMAQLSRMCQLFRDDTMFQQPRGRTLDIFGSYLSDETNAYDFIDPKENLMANGVQPRVPMFPEEFASGVPEHPLSWWGVLDPKIGEGKFGRKRKSNSAHDENTGLSRESSSKEQLQGDDGREGGQRRPAERLAHDDKWAGPPPVQHYENGRHNGHPHRNTSVSNFRVDDTASRRPDRPFADTERPGDVPHQRRRPDYGPPREARNGDEPTWDRRRNDIPPPMDHRDRMRYNNPPGGRRDDWNRRRPYDDRYDNGRPRGDNVRPLDDRDRFPPMRRSPERSTSPRRSQERSSDRQDHHSGDRPRGDNVHPPDARDRFPPARRSSERSSSPRRSQERGGYHPRDDGGRRDRPYDGRSRR